MVNEISALWSKQRRRFSYRDLLHRKQNDPGFVDHSTLHRWAITLLPVLAATFRRRKRVVGRSWAMDESYVKIGGQWK